MKNAGLASLCSVGLLIFSGILNEVEAFRFSWTKPKIPRLPGPFSRKTSCQPGRICERGSSDAVSSFLYMSDGESVGRRIGKPLKKFSGPRRNKETLAKKLSQKEPKPSKGSKGIKLKEEDVKESDTKLPHFASIDLSEADIALEVLAKGPTEIISEKVTSKTMDKSNVSSDAKVRLQRSAEVKPEESKAKTKTDRKAAKPETKNTGLKASKVLISDRAERKIENAEESTDGKVQKKSKLEDSPSSEDISMRNEKIVRNSGTTPSRDNDSKKDNEGKKKQTKVPSKTSDRSSSSIATRQTAVKAKTERMRKSAKELSAPKAYRSSRNDSKDSESGPQSVAKKYAAGSKPNSAGEKPDGRHNSSSETSLSERTPESRQNSRSVPRVNPFLDECESQNLSDSRSGAKDGKLKTDVASSVTDAAAGGDSMTNGYEQTADDAGDVGPTEEHDLVNKSESLVNPPFLSDEETKSRYPGRETSDRFSVESFNQPTRGRQPSSTRNEGPPHHDPKSAGMVGFLSNEERSQMFAQKESSGGQGWPQNEARSRNRHMPSSPPQLSIARPPTPESPKIGPRPNANDPKSPGMVSFMSKEERVRLFPPSSTPHERSDGSGMSDTKLSSTTEGIPAAAPLRMGPRPSANDPKSPGMVSFMSIEERRHLFPPAGSPNSNRLTDNLGKAPAAGDRDIRSLTPERGKMDSKPLASGVSNQSMTRNALGIQEQSGLSPPGNGNESGGVGRVSLRDLARMKWDGINPGDEIDPLALQEMSGEELSVGRNSNEVQSGGLEKIAEVQASPRVKNARGSAMSESDRTTLFSMRNRNQAMKARPSGKSATSQSKPVTNALKRQGFISRPPEIDQERVRGSTMPQMMEFAKPKGAKENNSDKLAADAGLSFSQSDETHGDHSNNGHTSSFGSQPPVNDSRSPGMVSFLSPFDTASMRPDAGAEQKRTKGQSPFSNSLPSRPASDPRSPGMIAFVGRPPSEQSYPAPEGRLFDADQSSSGPSAPTNNDIDVRLVDQGIVEEGYGDRLVREQISPELMDENLADRSFDDPGLRGDPLFEQAASMAAVSPFAEPELIDNRTPRPEDIEGTGMTPFEAEPEIFSDPLFPAMAPEVVDPRSPRMVAFLSESEKMQRYPGRQSTGVSQPLPAQGFRPSGEKREIYSPPRSRSDQDVLPEVPSQSPSLSAGDSCSPGMVAFLSESEKMQRYPGRQSTGSGMDQQSIPSTPFRTSGAQRDKLSLTHSQTSLERTSPAASPQPINSRSPGMVNFLSDSEKMQRYPGRQSTGRGVGGASVMDGEGFPQEVSAQKPPPKRPGKSPSMDIAKSSQEAEGSFGSLGGLKRERSSPQDISLLRKTADFAAKTRELNDRENLSQSTMPTFPIGEGGSSQPIGQGESSQQPVPGRLDMVEMPRLATNINDEDFLATVDKMSSLSSTPTKTKIGTPMQQYGRVAEAYARRSFRVVASEMAGRSRWGSMESNRVRNGGTGELSYVTMPPPVPKSQYDEKISMDLQRIERDEGYSVTPKLAKEWAFVDRGTSGLNPLPDFYSIASSMAEFALNASMRLITQGMGSGLQAQIPSMGAAVHPRANNARDDGTKGGQTSAALDSYDTDVVSFPITPPMKLDPVTAKEYEALALEWIERNTPKDPTATSDAYAYQVSDNAIRELARQWAARNKEPDTIDPSMRLTSKVDPSKQLRTSVKARSVSNTWLDSLSMALAAKNEILESPRSSQGPTFRVARVERGEETFAWSTVEVDSTGRPGSVLAAGLAYEPWAKRTRKVQRGDKWLEIQCDNLADNLPQRTAPVGKRRRALYGFSATQPLKDTAFSVTRVVRDALGGYRTYLISPYKRQDGEETRGQLDLPMIEESSMNVIDRAAQRSPGSETVLPYYQEELDRLQEGINSLQEEWVKLNKNVDSEDTSAAWDAPQGIPSQAYRPAISSGPPTYSDQSKPQATNPLETLSSEWTKMNKGE